MKVIIRNVFIYAVLCLLLPVAIGCSTSSFSDSTLLRVYEVNRKVADFPEKEDFSTPEAAYAVINRVMANGDRGAMRRISVKEIAEYLPAADAEKRTIPKEKADTYLQANIIEVRIFRGIVASVIVRMPEEGDTP